jgi:hypothetical protein
LISYLFGDENQKKSSFAIEVQYEWNHNFFIGVTKLSMRGRHPARTGFAPTQPGGESFYKMHHKRNHFDGLFSFRCYDSFQNDTFFPCLESRKLYKKSMKHLSNNRKKKKT